LRLTIVKSCFTQSVVKLINKNIIKGLTLYELRLKFNGGPRAREF